MTKDNEVSFIFNGPVQGIVGSQTNSEDAFKKANLKETLDTSMPTQAKSFLDHVKDSAKENDELYKLLAK